MVMTLYQLLLPHLVRSYFITVKIMFSSNYLCWYHLIIHFKITFQGMLISPPRYVRVTFHSTLNSLLSVLTISCPHMLNIIFLPLVDLTLLMWFHKYYTFKLLHKNYNLFSLKPLFSNLCLFLGCGESSSTLASSVSSISSPFGMSICQSSLSLASHSPSGSLIPQLDYHLWQNIPFDTNSNDLGVFHTLLDLSSLKILSNSWFLVILLSIVCSAIAKPFEMLSPPYMIHGFLWCIALHLSSSVMVLALICKSSSHTLLVFS